MIEVFTTKKQTPDKEDNWLYKDEAERRIFCKLVYLPDNTPLWAECTNEEKEEWEKEHKPEPETPKNAE